MSVQIRRSPAGRKRAPSESGSAPAPEVKHGAGPGTAEPRSGPSQDAALEGAAAHGNVRPKQQKPAPEEITAYWSRLRGNRPFPATSDLDLDRIASDWPDSVLFRCRSGSNALEPDRTFRPQSSGDAPILGARSEPGKIEFSPMMLQWLLSLASDAVRNRQPVEDADTFPAAQHSVRYSAVALPLSDNQSVIDHVLCHVRLG
jgi:hypothetical protein